MKLKIGKYDSSFTVGITYLRDCKCFVIDFGFYYIEIAFGEHK